MAVSPASFLRLSLLVALGACAQTPRARAEPDHATSAEIIGGKVDSGDPSIVAVLTRGTNKQGTCTGEVIAPRFVLTASHCIDARDLGFEAQQVIVVTAAKDIDEAPESARLLVVTATEHPEYDQASGANDIAVLELGQATDLPPLPFNHDPLPENVDGATVRAVGYGIAKDDESAPADTKREAELQLSKITQTTFLAASSAASQCHGDSGGPVLFPLAGKETIIGLGWQTLNQNGKCDLGVRNTRVDPLAAWVDGMLKADGSMKKAPSKKPPKSPPASDLAKCVDACNIDDDDCLFACAE